MIAGTPRDRFLVETDTPYLAPVPHRGKPNEPSFTVEIATRLGLELGLDLAATAALTTENFFRFFAKAASSLAALLLGVLSGPYPMGSSR